VLAVIDLDKVQNLELDLLAVFIAEHNGIDIFQFFSPHHRLASFYRGPCRASTRNVPRPSAAHAPSWQDSPAVPAAAGRAVRPRRSRYACRISAAATLSRRPRRLARDRSAA